MFNQNRKSRDSIHATRSALRASGCPAAYRNGRGRLVGGIIVVALGLVCLSFLPACGGQGAHAGSPVAARGASPQVRIGTYDSRAVAIAYARSKDFGESMSELRRQHAAAKVAGDSKLVAEFESQGQDRQVRLHLQGFSNAPVDDCLSAVRDRLAGIATRGGLVAIAASADWHDPNSELVDVTYEIAALFSPDSKTLAIIADLRKQKPIAIEAAAKVPTSE